MTPVFVGIGSNIDPALHLRLALEAMRRQFGELQLSPVYRSAAVGFDGDDFLNMVAGFSSNMDVWQIATALDSIEQQCGRQRQPARFAPRTIDLDLLLYGDMVVDKNGLRLPRDEILRYAFVLKPLADIAGGNRHPLTGKTYAALWREFNPAGQQLTAVDLDL